MRTICSKGLVHQTTLDVSIIGWRECLCQADFPLFRPVRGHPRFVDTLCGKR